MAFIQLDKPRKLKFGFNALEFIKSKLELENPMELFGLLQKGDLTVIKTILEACMIGDNAGVDSMLFGDMLDQYLEKYGLDKLGELLNETIEESAFFKASKKQEAKGKQKK